MQRVGSIAGVVIVAVFVAFFGLLALDLAWRVWILRGSFDHAGEIALLIALEVVRAVVALTVASLGARMATRPAPGWRALAAALLFLTLWYAKATTFGFPGFIQEKLALALLDAGVSRGVLAWMFGQPAWALAPAAAAFLLFALHYPAPPDPRRVRDVHATGRRGTLRGVALAGTDVRSLLHRFTATVLEAGLLRPAVLVSGAVAAAAALTFGGTVVRSGAWLLLAVEVLLALACLRTAWLSAAAPGARASLARLASAGAASFAGLAAGGVVGFAPGAVLAHVALVLSSLAPLAAVFLLAGLVREPPGAPQPA